MEESILLEILKEMQKKYQSIAEIERITLEIGESLSRNDNTAVQMLLGMRQEEMDKVDIINRNTRCLTSVLSSEEAGQVESWLRGLEDEKSKEPISEKIIGKGKSIQLLLKRTIEIDKCLNTRIAGTQSFYN